MAKKRTKGSVRRGAILVGPKHTQGGISVHNKSNPQKDIEVEGGEVVITAPAVFDPAVRTLTGTNKEILSQINQSGGGVAILENGGQVPEKIPCGGRLYEYGGRVMTDYAIVKQCGCQHELKDGGNIDSLLDSFSNVPLPSFFKEAYKGRPDELIWFIQEQATGLDPQRKTVFFPPAYAESTNLVGKDLVLAAVRALPSPTKKLLIRSWKGKIVDPELRGAVKTEMKAGGILDDPYLLMMRKGGTLSSRKADYALLPESDKFVDPTIFKTLRRGGELVGPPDRYKKGGILAEKFENAYELNKAIERLIDEKKGLKNAIYSDEEKMFISHYSGYGGLEKFGASGKGLLYEYFTPPAVARAMWGLAYKFGYKGGDVLEPAAGIGEFLKYAPDDASITALEINPYSAEILSVLYPSAIVLPQYFEQLFIANRNTIKSKLQGLTKYDLVIGNPPYGEFGGLYAGMGEKNYTRAGNYIDYFLFRGLDLLRPGGLLIYVIGAEVAAGGKLFLDQQMSPVKREIMNKSTLLDAYRLPNGIFERTDVLTDIIVLQKK